MNSDDIIYLSTVLIGVVSIVINLYLIIKDRFF